MGDVELVNLILQKLSVEDLLKCKDLLTSAINHAYARRNAEIKSKKAVDFVKHGEDCKEFRLDPSDLLYGGIAADLVSLKLKPNGTHPVTKWLTSDGQAYSWQSNNGHCTVKDPVDIKESSFIHDAMKEINSKFGVNMNSCLVSYYSKGSVYARLHDDSENSLDQNEPICVVSLGAERTIEFFHQGQDGRSKCVHSITPPDGSLYVMLPGCQQNFKHRVKSDSQINKGRYCLSFRRILPSVEPSTPQAGAHTATTVLTISTPVKDVVKQIDGGMWATRTVKSDTSLVSPNVSLVTPPPSSNKWNDSFKTPPTSPPKRKKTTVLFGTSMTLNVHKRIGKLAAGRNLVNVSNRGAKIRDILIHVQDFHDTHEAADDIEKIIFSLGTNDIKFSRRGVNHLKHFVIELIDRTKYLFPGAIILFQCCLPIRNLYWYTASNVLDFNTMLKSLCYDLNCVFVDCFHLFLSADRMDHNTSLFYDWLHLNWNGKGILGNWLTYVIKQNSYNFVLDRVGDYN